MPGSRRSSSGWSCSNWIRTGMRCTTLVKLPVALSGGSSANCDPLAGAIRSTRPCSFSPRETVDRDVDWLARLDPRQLRFLVIGDHIDVRQRHDVDEVGADIDVVAGLHLPLADDAVERRDDPGVAELEFCGGERRLGGLEIGGTLLLGPAALRADGAARRSRRGSRARRPAPWHRPRSPARASAVCRLRSATTTAGAPAPGAPRLPAPRRRPARLGLRDGRVLQLDLVVQIVERGLRGGDAGLGLRDLGLIIGRIDLHQQIAGLDALKIGDGDRQHFARDPAAHRVSSART